MNDTIKFDKELLLIMSSTRHDNISSIKSELTSTLGKMQDMLREVPQQIVTALLESSIRSLRNEDEAKEFAKLLVYASRLFNQIEELEEEVIVIDTILDEESIIRMATGINFKEYFEEQDEWCSGTFTPNR